MTVEKDWLSYLFEPASLLKDLNNNLLSDEHRVTLMKNFLSQAELHDRRTAAITTTIPGNDGLLSDLGGFSSSGNYDKSRMLDRLALQLAASFRFSVNLFSGPVTELPLRLSSRLYRSLFLTLLEENGHTKDAGDLMCTTPYDLGPWDSLEPALAFATLSYHLWCLQVAFATSLLPQPLRNLTPVVAGLSEVPDVAFLPDSRADLEAILVRHEESALRLTELLKDANAVSIIRPRPSSFRALDNGGQIEEKKATDSLDVLPPHRILAACSFALGRLAFQHRLMQQATELFQTAYVNLKGLDCLEEAGATPALIENYLTACQSYHNHSPFPPLTPVVSTLSNSPFKLVEGFCNSLEAACATLTFGKEGGESELLQLLPQILDSTSAALTQSAKPNLRTSPSKASQPITPKKNTNGCTPISQTILLEALREDLFADHDEQDKRNSKILLSNGLRLRLEQLILTCLTKLSELTAGGDGKERKLKTKEITQLRSAYNEWRDLYSKVVASNVLKSILCGSVTHSSNFITQLLNLPEITSTSPPPPSSTFLNPEAAQDFLFDEMSSHLLLTPQSRLSEDQRKALHQFLGELTTRLLQHCPVSGDNQIFYNRLLVLVEALINNNLFNQLPNNLQSLVKSLGDFFTGASTSKVSCLTSSNLPDTKCPEFDYWTVYTVNAVGGGVDTDIDMRSAQSHQPELRVILSTSMEPKLVVKTIGDMVDSGWSPIQLLHLEAAWIPALTHFLRFFNDSPLQPPPQKHIPAKSVFVGGGGGRRNNIPPQAMMDSQPPGGPVCSNEQHTPTDNELFSSIISDNPQLLTSIILLARGSLARRLFVDWRTGHAFSSAALHNLLMLDHGGHEPISGPPNIVRNPLRWIRSVCEHELLLLDLLEMLAPTYTSAVHNDASSLKTVDGKCLARRCKPLLLQAAGLPSLSSSELGEICISDELVTTSSCLLLHAQDYNFLMPYSPPTVGQLVALPPAMFPLPALSESSTTAMVVAPLELVRFLMRLHIVGGKMTSSDSRTDEAAAAAHDLCQLIAHLLGNGGGGQPPHFINGLIWLLSEMEVESGEQVTGDFSGGVMHPLHHLLDNLILALASISSVFPSDLPSLHLINPPTWSTSKADIWPSASSSNFSPSVVSSACILLRSALQQGLAKAPWRVDWMLISANQTPIDFSAATLSRLLEVGAVCSDFFSQPVPKHIFTERVVRMMVECCQAMGLLGEAIVLCQLAPEQSLIRTGLQLIDNLRSSLSNTNGDSDPSSAKPAVAVDKPTTVSFDCLDSLADFFWDLDLLEALTTLQFNSGSLSKRNTFMMSINQPELNASNSTDILQLTRNKRASEFLRLLSRSHFH